MTDVLVAVSQNNIEEGLCLCIGKREQYELIRSGVDINTIKMEANAANIVEIKERDLGISRESKVVLSIGPFKIQKDPVSFVDIASMVLKEVPETIFLWAGTGELHQQVVSQIDKYEIRGNVQLLGWRDDIVDLLKICDVFVLTSLWEGLPRAGVEALIVGKPVVAFAVNGVPEIIKNNQNGFAIPPGKKVDFAKRVIEILKDEKLYKKLSENAAKTIDESFDINIMVEQQEKLYD